MRFDIRFIQVTSSSRVWLRPIAKACGVALWGAAVLLLAGDAARTAPTASIVEPYHIGVWYFASWHTTAGLPQLALGKRVYGRSDPWVGVRDYAEGHGAVPIIDPGTNRSPDFGHRRPLIGYYDLMSDRTVAAEIEEAASEGIEFFAFYWYLDLDTGQELGVSAPVNKFFSSSVANEMKYILAPIIGPGRFKPISLKVWEATVVPKILGYMAQSTYMRLNGRPVLIEFGVEFQTPDQMRLANDYLRTKGHQHLGVEPLIISLLGQKATYQNLLTRERIGKSDGFTCFNFPIEGNPEPYTRFIDNWIPAMQAQMAKPGGLPDPRLTYIPCGSVGIDARPWYGVGWGNWGRFKAADPNGRPFTAGTTPQTFREHLIKLKSFIDSDTVHTLGAAIIYAWNEWGEAAAAIEPSAVDGYAYAHQIREVFGLIPRRPRPALPQTSP